MRFASMVRKRPQTVWHNSQNEFKTIAEIWLF
jgi:hypothetical protein